jgi:ATP-dependent Lon protease
MTPWSAEKFEFDDNAFDGRARLFPLPDLVLFPHVMQPLHIFEPRYREMVQEALDTDRLLAVVRLEPGWEADYEGRPPVASVACLGKIVSEHRLDDGRFNILLLGLRRIAIVREVVTKGSFRVADVRILEDEQSPEHREERRCLRRELLNTFRGALPASQGVKDTIATLLKKHVPLGVLADLIAFTAELDGPFKQSLLAETRVVERARALLARLKESRKTGPTWPKAMGGFPPSFSVN